MSKDEVHALLSTMTTWVEPVKRSRGRWRSHEDLPSTRLCLWGPHCGDCTHPPVHTGILRSASCEETDESRRATQSVLLYGRWNPPLHSERHSWSSPSTIDNQPHLFDLSLAFGCGASSSTMFVLLVSAGGRLGRTARGPSICFGLLDEHLGSAYVMNQATGSFSRPLELHYPAFRPDCTTYYTLPGCPCMRRADGRRRRDSLVTPRAGRATGLSGDARQRNQMLGLTGYGRVPLTRIIVASS